jgi:hypothetical protein
MQSMLSFYEVLAEGQHLIYSVKDETQWFKTRYSSLMLLDPASNPSVKLDFLNEEDYSNVVLSKPTANNHAVSLTGDNHDDGFQLNVPTSSMPVPNNTQIGFLPLQQQQHQQRNFMESFSTVWSGYKSPKVC